MRPFKDPDTGKITMETVTRHNKGIDIGEIHEVEEGSVKSKAEIEAQNEKGWKEAEEKAAARVNVEGTD